MTIETVTYCSGSYFALLIPYAFWFGITGVQYYTADISLVYIGALYFPQLFINHLLKLLIERDQINGCRGQGILESPSLETQLTFSAIVFLLIIDNFTPSRIHPCKKVALFLLGIYVAIALVLSGDSSLEAVVLGGLVGALFTAGAYIFFWVFAEPCYRCCLQWDYIAGKEYTDNICSRNEER